MILNYFVIFVTFIVTTFLTSNYDIPSYYGFFSLRYFQPSFITTGKLTRLEFHFRVDANYQNNTIYYANKNQNCVYKYSLDTQKLQVLIGQCGTEGNLIGSRQLAMFNSVQSVVYFRSPSESFLNQLKQQRVIIAANGSCDLLRADCILNEPYPALKMENLRYVSNVSLFDDEPNQPEFLFLADTNNHCIKKFSFRDNQVSIVAGSCGVSGFLDGPLGYNRLNMPSHMGISREGVLYFFDSGNQYFRIVDLNGRVSTLLLGACKKFYDKREVLGLELSQILCYENWIEGVTQSSINHFFNESILNICTNQSSQCAYQ